MEHDTPAPVSAGEGAEITCAGKQHAYIEPPVKNQSRAFELWDYQSEVIAKVDAAIATGKRRVLLVAPTGAGKTVIAAAIIHSARERGKRILFLDHRRELTSQCSKKLHAVGVDHGIIQAGFPSRPCERVQVASVQTLHARAVRSRALEMPAADLVIVDEAHHVRARTYRKILDAYPDAVVIGLTATPCRADGRGLGNVFDMLVECPQIAELQAGGYLVRARVYAPSRPDLRGVQVKKGDYVESQLAARVDTQKLVGDLVEHWHRLNPDRRPTVIFATGVQHSVHIRNELRRAGVLAEHIDGSTPIEERDRILAHLANGTIEVVVNCAVLTEGWDCPEVSCLVLARPTKSLGLYRQMVGRALRTSDGKTDALIIDHAGACFEHGLIEEPVLWTLDEDKKAENEAQTARKERRAREMVDCPECHAVKWEGEPCPACGWTPRPKAKPVQHEEGDLARVEHGRTVTGESPYAPGPFFAQLTYYGRSRGYSPGWAAHKFREKFGTWPPRGPVAPIPPTPAVASWIRSRLIAYARAKEKSGQ